MDERLNAANVILNRGVRFHLPAPFYKRWLKKDYVTIRYLKVGTILEISRVVIESDLENVVMLGGYDLLEASVEACARCVAIAILNDKDKIARRTDKLTQYLLWKVSPQSLIDLFRLISSMNRLQDFTSITRYLLSQMTMMMNRKNLGHEENGG